MPESLRLGRNGEITIQVRDADEALRMLATTTMRPFTQQDWYGYSGCETKDPMIGEHGDFTIILDGPTINIIHFEDGYGGTMFKLKEI